MRESAAAKRLRQQIERLLDGQKDDARLRDNLEGLAHDVALPGLTWFWGPALYERNRVTFRPFILNHFSDWQTDGRSWSRVKWKDRAGQLDAWLSEARKNRDSNLVRRLLAWKYAGKNWGIDEKAFGAALVREYETASGPAARAIVLDEFNSSFSLTEETAIALYRIDRAAGPFLLQHLRRGFWGDDKRALWTRLMTAAEEEGDEEFRWSLYRKQVPVKQWQAEVLALAQQIRESHELTEELERRHPEGWGLDLSAGAIKLLEGRGRDVMPYIRAKLSDLLGEWFSNRAQPFVKLAERNGWWDLWAAVIRANHNPQLFNEAVGDLLADRAITENDRIGRLKALAGVSREWNWPGFGLAMVHGLKDELAARLYRRYPDLVHGPMKPHVVPTWWQGYAELLGAAQERADEELIDLLASRYVTQIYWDSPWRAKERGRIMETVEKLADSYQELRDRDAVLFARRAADVLTRVPTYSIHSYSRLLRTNKLARLLFVRSFDAYLAVPGAVRDLVEGSDIHVQMLAYNVLAQDDDRARRLAAESLDILAGTLLRPLHRKTRLAAFRALANAAAADADSGRFVLRRAREALRLPDKKYPKEELVGLIGRVLHVRPELRSMSEQPVIYGLEAAAP